MYKLKVGFPSYLNALPFFKYLPAHLYELHFAPPTELNAHLREGKIDAGMVSVVEYLDGNYACSAQYGIAADGPILSVNLYVKEESVTPSLIALTPESATSVALLKVLCHHYWNISPTFTIWDKTKPLDTYEALLLIGNDALHNYTISGYRRIDLAQSWKEATGLPFVFALLTYRKSLNISDLNKSLDLSLSLCASNRRELISHGCALSSLPADFLDHYYTCCRHRLGAKEWEGVKLFNRLRTCTMPHSQKPSAHSLVASHKATTKPILSSL